MLWHHRHIADPLEQAVGYVAAIDATVMFLVFQPASIIMVSFECAQYCCEADLAQIRAMRRSLKFRRQAQTTNDTLPVMSSMLRVLIVYTLYTSIWMLCTMALQWAMIIAGNVGDVSPSVLEKLQLRIMMWLHGFGTFISAIVLAVVPLFRLRKKANASSGKSARCQGTSFLIR